MRHVIVFSLTVAATMIFTFSCERNSNDIKIIRPLIYLKTEDIPTFHGMTQIRYDEIPRAGIKDSTGNYTAEVTFSWKSDNGNFSYIDISATESNESAICILLNSHKLYTNPYIEENRDKPAAVGDLSYYQGVEFIRDNLIVKIHASEIFDNSITEIAKYVDAKIRKSPTFTSSAQIRPVIIDFRISKNPVIERTQTLLIIQTEDPNNQEIFHEWRFDKASGYGGIHEDGLGNYYYSSSWADTTDIKLGLTLIAINKYGFCDDSTIYIQTIKE